jgi:hypothetical protein
MVLVALTLFAVLLILAHDARPLPRAVWLGVLVVSVYALPGASKVAGPVGAILALALGESLASMRSE